MDSMIWLINFPNKGQEIKAKGTGMNQKEHIQLLVTVMQDITAEIDNIFGEDCCEKVFDTTAPSPYAVADFFDQMLPIFDRYTNERQNALQISIAGRDRVAHLTRNMAVTARIEGRDRYVQCHAGQAAI